MAVAAPVAERAALAASALAGDEEALGGLLTMHQQAAYNVAYRLLGCEADAYDAVQEAFVLALRAIRGEAASPREIDRFEPWLLKVVTNAALGQLRRRPRVAPLSVDELMEALPAPERSEPSREAERREARGDVLRALLALPDAQRAALTLREYQGLSYDEIAAALGISRAAVETLLFRARRGFRAAYEGLAAAPQLIGCPELAPLLSVMIDNELEASALMELSGHVARCPCCRHELDQLRRTRRLHALIPLVAAPAGLYSAAMSGSVAAAASSQAAPVASTSLAGALAAKLSALSAANVAAAVAVAFGLAIVAIPLLGNEVAALSESVSKDELMARAGSDVPISSERTAFAEAGTTRESSLDSASSASIIVVDVNVDIPSTADPSLATTGPEASLSIAPPAMAQAPSYADSIGAMLVQPSPLENQVRDSASGWTRSEESPEQPGELPLGQVGDIVATQVELAVGVVDQALEQLVEPLEVTAIDQLEQAASLVEETVEELARPLVPIATTQASPRRRVQPAAAALQEVAAPLEGEPGSVETAAVPAGDVVADVLSQPQPLDASVAEGELIESATEQPAQELVTQSALAEEPPAEAPTTGTTTPVLETSPESAGGTAVSVSTAPAPSAPTTSSVPSTAQVQSDTSTASAPSTDTTKAPSAPLKLPKK
jgi:RNA polymerase sigma-70 factor (ECF subfamily)